MRFFDTMALHIAVSGLTGLQRILYVASKTGSRRKEVVEHEQDQAMFGNSQVSNML
jgi:DNA polymerase gamma 1